MEPKDRIILPLDVDNLRSADALVRELAPYVGFFKIGLELISSVGGSVAVDFVHERGGKVFYDGKFDDIPNTVGRAAKAVAGQRVAAFNLHASAGRDAIAAAVANKGNSLVWGVTVLTSIAEDECTRIFGHPPFAKVRQFGHYLVEAGADGMICSPQELEFLSMDDKLRSFTKVTPGIRAKDAPPDDQRRTMTAGEAVRAGATYLVIGRPITTASSPVDAAKAFANEIAAAV